MESGAGVLERSPCNLVHMSERFTKITEKGGKQYAHIYCARSDTLKGRCCS